MTMTANRWVSQGRRARRLALWSLVLLGLFAGGCWVAAGEGKSGVEKDDAAPEEPKVLVRVGDFVRGDISNELAVAADLEAVAEADVPSQLAGVVREVALQEGDRLSAGDPVVYLVDDEYTLTTENKRILFDQADTKLKQADLALRETEALQDQKRLLVEEAEAAYDRLSKLAGGDAGIVSQEELEAKRYERDRAKIDLRSIELQLEKKRLERTQAEQDKRLAKVELQTSELNLSRTVLRSPIDGYISYLDIKLGEQVTTNALVFSVVDIENLRARLHVPQKELRRLRVNQPVRITSDIYPGEVFPGVVSVINPVIDRENGTVTVLVGIHDDKHLLKPGMFVSGEIIIDVHRDALLVSKRAVTYENQEPVVFIVRDGVARRYVLNPGYSDRDHIEVLELTDMQGRRWDTPDGELVLVGHDKIKDGSPVDIERAPPAAQHSDS